MLYNSTVGREATLLPERYNSKVISIGKQTQFHCALHALLLLVPRLACLHAKSNCDKNASTRLAGSVGRVNTCSGSQEAMPCRCYLILSRRQLCRTWNEN